MISLEGFWHEVAIVIGVTFVGGRLCARWLRARGLRWTWALLGFGLTFVLSLFRCLPVVSPGRVWSLAGRARSGIGAIWRRGATGSGKTVSEAWIAGRLVAHGHGAIVIDPKGDDGLRAELQRAARMACRPFLEWTPKGPCSYNPYASGSDGEIVDKALAGEVFAEPHYLRLTPRYLGHAVRTMRAAKIPITVGILEATTNRRSTPVGCSSCIRARRS
jgi:hypothetical protein